MLEIGCGTGNITIQALEMGYKVTGIDISRTAIQTARERAQARGFHPDLNVLDILMDDLPDDVYDAVFLHHVLGSMWKEERIEAIKKVISSIKPGGELSFIDFSVNDMRYGEGQEVEKDTFMKGSGFIQHYFTTDEAKELISDLEAIRVEEISWEQGAGKDAQKRSRIIGQFTDYSGIS